MRPRTYLGLALAGVLLLGLVLIQAFPLRPPPPLAGPQAGRLVLAADGLALGQTGQPHRLQAPLLRPEQIPPLVEAAALAAEDRRFFSHPGVDPLALARALWQNLSAGRVVSGGSTITMQLARLLHPAPRTLGGKLREMLRALRLEAGLSKREILCAYLNRAPFGGPMVGLGSACLRLWDQPPGRLSPAQAALLMSLPQDPARLLRAAQRPRLQTRRNHVLAAMAQAGALSPAALARASVAPLDLDRPRREGPPAPHFLTALAARLPARAPREVATFLDRDLQLALDSLVARVCAQGWERGLRQAAILVLDNRDLSVKAWVGSPDFAALPHGQVDGVLARRQPGSALKPFLYALALDWGHELADQVEDEPLALRVAGGSFRPLDYDGQTRGRVSLRVALASSLNLPALRLTRLMGPPALLQALRDLGFALPLAAQHYGLGLSLGDGEVSLLEMTQAYAALARGGEFAPARLWQGQKPALSHRVFSPAACRLVADVLADDRARASGFGRHGVLELPFPAAVKTGTSQNHRDNWCLGFTSAYTVGVWAGNFSGAPMVGLSGVEGAAPLWRQAMLLLHHQSPGELPPWPAGVELRPLGPPGPGAVLEYFMPRPQPAPAQVQGPAPQPDLELIAPLDGAVYALDPDLDPSLQVLTCRVEAGQGWQKILWRLDGQPLAPGPDPRQARAPLRPGRHVLEVTAWVQGRPSRARARFIVQGLGRPLPRAARKPHAGNGEVS